MYVCVYIYIPICNMYMHTHAFSFYLPVARVPHIAIEHVCVYTCVYTCIHIIYTYMYIYTVHTHTCKPLFKPCVRHIYVTYTCVHMHVYIHVPVARMPDITVEHVSASLAVEVASSVWNVSLAVIQNTEICQTIRVCVCVCECLYVCVLCVYV